jgi:hypothetical protein
VTGGATTLTGTTVFSNQAGGGGAAGTRPTKGGGGGGGGTGGGIFVSNGTLLLSDSTVADNGAAGGKGNTSIPTGTGGSGGGGGGLFAGTGATFTITNSTVAGNDAGAGTAGSAAPGTSGVGGGLDSITLPGTRRNSIVANNSASVSGNGPDIAGGISANYTLIGNTSGALNLGNVGNVSNTAAGLGVLRNNGGPTPTMALLAGSPAIDAGDPAFAPPPATDQRGQPRVSNGRIDLGAFELQIPGPPPTLTGLSPGTAVEGSTAFTLTLTGSNFDSTAIVLWNGTGLTTRLTSATQLEAQVPAGLAADEGTATVSVTEDAVTSAGLPFRITDAGLGGLSIHTPGATEGASTSGIVVATFSDADAAAPTTDFTATVTWGDGSSGAATVASLGGGAFLVLASHTYAEDGTKTLSVAVQDDGGASVSGSVTLSVADAALGNLVVTDPGGEVEGKGTGTFTLATFRDANTAAPATDFTATIRWGDGSSSGTVVSTGGGSFAVLASHTFAEEGAKTVAVQVLDAGGSSIRGSFKATVADAPLTLTAVHAPAGATEGAGTGAFTVATFTDGNAGAPLTDFTAVVSWGDGTTSTVTSGNGISGSGGSFVVQASHTYAEEIHTATVLSVQILDVGGSSAGSVSSPLTVADARLTLQSLAPPAVTAGTAFNGPVATFRDGNPAAAGDFRATVSWGDGTTSSASVVSLGGDSFGVTASHTYAQAGALPFAVSVSDAGGSVLSATGTASVSAVPVSSATGAQWQRVALDALFVADGILTGNTALYLLGLGGYLHLVNPLPSAVTMQLGQEFYFDLLSDLVALGSFS